MGWQGAMTLFDRRKPLFAKVDLSHQDSSSPPWILGKTVLTSSDRGMCSAALSANWLYALGQNHSPDLFPPWASLHPSFR